MKKLLAVIVGAVLVLVGILLLFLPGPGILLILAGAALLWRAFRGGPKPAGPGEKPGRVWDTDGGSGAQDR